MGMKTLVGYPFKTMVSPKAELYKVRAQDPLNNFTFETQAPIKTLLFLVYQRRGPSKELSSRGGVAYWQICDTTMWRNGTKHSHAGQKIHKHNVTRSCSDSKVTSDLKKLTSSAERCQ